MRTRVFLLFVGLASAPLAWAQSSPSYRLSESTFNLGGRPEAGQIATSPSHEITLDSLGEAIAGRGLSSASFRMNGGFLNLYAPPGEVPELNLDSATHLFWDPEGSAGTYNVYRGSVASLPGGYGSCLESGIASIETTDALVPAVGSANFYLVTVSNRLGEEGTKGSTSGGMERPTPSPCP